MTRIVSLTITIVVCWAPSLFAQSSGNPHVDFIDVNNLFLWAATNGMTSHSPITDGPGLEFPKGSGKYVMFSEGLVWGGMSDGELCVGGATYRYGLQSGKILSPGVAANPTDPRYRIYKVRRLNMAAYDQLPLDVQERLRRDFMEWPVTDGAPWLDVDANGRYEPDFDKWLSGSTAYDSPQFEGDEVLWWVSNDLDRVRTNYLYGSPTVGLEIQTTFWAYDADGALGNTVFMKHKLLNKSMEMYSDVYIGKWIDPDVGYAFDDFVGISEACQTGFAYNGEDYDTVYAERPPAVGHVLLQGPIVPRAGHYAMYNGAPLEGFMNLPVSSYVFYINGDEVYRDPVLGSNFGATMAYRYMTCMMWNGQPVIDPVTGYPVCLALSGDPIANTGWIDGKTKPPGDRRAFMSAGPFDIAPGDTQEVVYAVTVAQGNDRLHSVELLLGQACALRSEWISGLPVSTPELSVLPERPALDAPYPNPVTSSAAVNYTLQAQSTISLKLVDVLGRTVATVEEGTHAPGTHTSTLSTTALKPGTYFLRLETPGGVQVKAVAVVR